MVEKNTKIRANTMIEKRGFRDDDLYKIDHDKICSWLYDNCDAWLKKRFIGHKVNYIPNNYGGGRDVSDKKIVIQNVARITKTPEYAIKDKNFVIGFIDLVVTCSFELKDLSEEKFLNNDSSIKFVVCFEVKTSYDSFGALKREFNYYKEYKRNSKFVLVGPHNEKIKEEMKQISVEFIDYDEETETEVIEEVLE